MHVSLDSALGRQRRLNQIGESITQIAPDPAAAYSLRSLTGSDPKVVRVRRGSDNDERDFTASEVSSGALTSYVNAQVVAPLDIKALSATGRDGAYQIAKAAYSLRSLGTRQATIPNDAAPLNEDTVVPASGKYVCQVRRNVNGDLKSFTADEVSDGTLTSFVNESFTSSLPLDVAGSAAAAYGLRNLSSSYTGNVVEVRRASDDTKQNFTAAEVADGTLVSFVTESFQKTLSVEPLGQDSTWDVTVVDNSNYTIDCNNNTSTKFCRLINTSLPAGTKYRAEFTLTTNSGDASNLKLNRSSPFNLQNITEGSNSIEFDFTTATFLQFRVGAGSSVFNATISNLTVTAIGNDGHVSTWYDQSGNSNNATQATAANQPKIVDGGALVTDGLDFDGTDDFLSQSSGFSLTGSDDLSFFTAYKPDVTNATITLLSQNDGTGTGRAWLSLRDDADIASYLGGGAKDFFSAGSTTDKTLMSVIYDDSANTIDGFKNSVAGTQGTSVSIEAASGVLNIGQSKGNGERFNGHINEVIIYLSDQTDKRRAIEESIATANGITLGSFSRDGFVKTWYDQSVSDQSDAGSTPTGNHATQATADNQPKIVEGGTLLTLSGKPTIKPDGTDDFLINQSSIWDTITNTALSCMTVAGMTSSVNKQLWAIGSSTDNDGDWLIGAASSSGNVKWRGARIISNPVSIATSGTVLLTALDVTGGDAFINGASMGVLSTSSPSTTADRLVLFARRAGDSFTNQAISEAIFYDTDQTDNRVAIEANIGETYSIDLPSGVDPGFDQVDGFVETWYDQSGNGNDATQATADNQPKIVSAGSLVSGGIEFDGSNDKLNASYSSSGTTNAYLLTAVATIANSTGNQTILATGSGSWGGDDAWLFKRRSGLNNELAIETSNGGGILSPANYTSLESLVVAQGDSTDTKLFSNGSEVATGSVITIETQNIQIANRANSSILSGKINEIIVYFTDQSANRTAIEANINGHYSIF
jgi:hypothetical protein